MCGHEEGWCTKQEVRLEARDLKEKHISYTHDCRLFISLPQAPDSSAENGVNSAQNCFKNKKINEHAITKVLYHTALLLLSCLFLPLDYTYSKIMCFTLSLSSVPIRKRYFISIGRWC